jgi:hypothetical protein
VHSADYIAVGAGIEEFGGGSFTLTNVEITNNALSNTVGNAYGGGIDESSGDSNTLSAVTISGNAANGATGEAASGGGGISAEGELSGSFTIVNATISNNTTSGTGASGGGIYNVGDSLALTNATLSGNGAPTGGNIFQTPLIPRVAPRAIPVAGQITLQGTIVANPAQGANCSGPVVSQGDNLSSDSSCVLTAPGDQQNKNPQLGPLADNGGPAVGATALTSPTLTEALLAGSPAIDADPTGCPPPATDERGVSRPQGKACDIGAYEAQAQGVAPTETCSSTVGLYVSCTITLTSAVPAGSTVTKTVVSPPLAFITSCFAGSTPGAGGSGTCTVTSQKTAVLSCPAGCPAGTSFTVNLLLVIGGPLTEQLAISAPGGGAPQSFTVSPGASTSPSLGPGTATPSTNPSFGPDTLTPSTNPGFGPGLELPGLFPGFGPGTLIPNPNPGGGQGR